MIAFALAPPDRAWYAISVYDEAEKLRREHGPFSATAAQCATILEGLRKQVMPSDKLVLKQWSRADFRWVRKT